MAVNIGPKIGIDGEKEYRAEINKIIQQSKTLAAEMNDVASAVDNETDKEKASEAVKAKLAEQIANQKKLVDKLEDAVKKSTAATGEDSQATLKWKEQLAKAKSELNKMESSARGTTGEVEKLGNEEEDATKKTSIFGDVLKANLASEAIVKGEKMIADGIKKIGQAAVETVTDTAEYADEINTLTKTTGMSTDAIQEYKYAADILDVSFDTIQSSQTKLIKSMRSAQDGSGETADAFAALGVAVTDENGALRSNQAVFDDVIRALGEIENPTERDALAMQILGKSAQDLNPLILAGADAMNDLRREAHEVGAVMSGEELDAMSEVQDSLNRTQNALEAMKRQLGTKIGIAFLPDIEKAVGLLQDLSKSGDIETFTKKSLDMVGSFFKKVGEKAKGAIGKLPKLLSKAADSKLWSDLGETIGKTLGNLFANAPKIIAAGGKLGWSLIKGIVNIIPNMFAEISKAIRDGRLSDAAKAEIEKLQEARDALQEIERAEDRVGSSIANANAKQQEAEHWIEIFDKISNKANPTAVETERLKTAVSKLNELFPELNLTFDGETGKWSATTSEIRNSIQAMSDYYRAQAYYEAGSGTFVDVAKLDLEATKNEELAEEHRKQAEELKKTYDEYKTLWDQAVEIRKKLYSGEFSNEEAISAAQLLGFDGNDAQGIYTWIKELGEVWVEAERGYNEAAKLRDEYTETAEAQRDKIAELEADIELLYKKAEELTTAAQEKSAEVEESVESRMQQTEDRQKRTANHAFDTLTKDAQKKSIALGEAIGDGIDIGFDHKMGPLKMKAKELIDAALNTMRETAQINSPSKITEKYGEYMGIGLIEGWEKVFAPTRIRKAFALSTAFDAMTTGGVVNNTTTINLGGVSATVNAAAGQNVNEIADAVMIKMQRAANRRKAVYA